MLNFQFCFLDHVTGNWALPQRGLVMVWGFKPNQRVVSLGVHILDQLLSRNDDSQAWTPSPLIPPLIRKEP